MSWRAVEELGGHDIAVVARKLTTDQAYRAADHIARLALRRNSEPDLCDRPLSESDLEAITDAERRLDDQGFTMQETWEELDGQPETSPEAVDVAFLKARAYGSARAAVEGDLLNAIYEAYSADVTWAEIGGILDAALSESEQE